MPTTGGERTKCPLNSGGAMCRAVSCGSGGYLGHRDSRMTTWRVVVKGGLRRCEAGAFSTRSVGEKAENNPVVRAPKHVNRYAASMCENTSCVRWCIGIGRPIGLNTAACGNRMCSRATWPPLRGTPFSWPGPPASFRTSYHLPLVAGSPSIKLGTGFWKSLAER